MDKKVATGIAGDHSMANQELASGSEPVTNIVLVGRSGNGKSATGNSILRQNPNPFISKADAGGVTMHCEMFRAAIEGGPIINVIDTPEEEESTLNTLQRIFESTIIDYLIVVFTGGDELEYNDQTLDDYLRNATPEFLRNVLRLSGHRKVLFNNRTKDEGQKAEQLKQLLDHIETIKKKNGGKPYTDQMHRKIKEENDKLREKEIESKKLAEADSILFIEKSRMEHENSMNMMAQMLENALKQNSEAYDNKFREMKDTLQQGQQLLPFRRPGIKVECNIM